MSRYWGQGSAIVIAKIVTVEMTSPNSFGNSFDFAPNVSVFGDAFSFVYYFGATHPQGRDPIGLNQSPSNGSDYPFVRPSADIRYLLGDLFVSFDSLDNSFEMPLRVAWLYGFGTRAATAPSWAPTPTHALEMLIVDANDQVVADTSLATSFKVHDWNDRLQVLEWIVSETCVVRCVRYMAWSLEEVLRQQVIFYRTHIVPDNGVLATEACYRIPKRVRSITVGLARYTDTPLAIQEGYNITLAEEVPNATVDVAQLGLRSTPTLVPGQRVAHRIRISAIPGAGLGVQPGCVDTTTELKTINKIRPNSAQNFNLDASGCIRVQRPVALAQPSPRQLSYALTGHSAAEAAATIGLHDNCKPCCDCEDFARVYQGLKRQWFQYKDVAATAEAVRNAYEANILRWEQARLQRASQSIRMRLQADGECKVSWGFVHCNSSKCCLLRVKAVMTWLYYVNGVLTVPTRAAFDCQKTSMQGADQCEFPATTLLSRPGTSNDSRVYLLEWDYADPQKPTTAQGRICFPECSQVVPQSLRVRLHLVLFWEDSLPNADSTLPCDYPLLAEADIPADVKTVWAANGVSFLAESLRVQRLSPLLTVSSDNRLCEACNCE